LEKVNYPEAFKAFLPTNSTLPSREALLGVDREEAVASLKMLKDNFLELLEATAAKGRSNLTTVTDTRVSGESQTILAALPSPRSLATMSKEEMVQRLEQAGYPDSFHNVLPTGTTLVDLNDTFKALSVDEMRLIVETLRERITQ